MCLISRFVIYWLRLFPAHAHNQTLILDTLAHIVSHFPTLHRTLHGSLSSLALQNLNGSAPRPVDEALLQASSRLYSVLHHIGGKVGAAQQWRKFVDDTLQFAWTAVSNLRTTYPSLSRWLHLISVYWSRILFVRHECRFSSANFASWWSNRYPSQSRPA